MRVSYVSKGEEKKKKKENKSKLILFKIEKIIFHIAFLYLYFKSH